MAKIKFIQTGNDVVDSFEKDFSSIEEVKEWVLEDKRTGYGDILAYGGKFKGISAAQANKLKALTMEDAIEKLSDVLLVKET